jgi:hypothetical protein
MKRSFLVAVGGVLSLAAGVAAQAQMQKSVYVVNVPFAFFVGSRELPAGTYYVDSKRPFFNSALTIESIRRGGEAGVTLPTTSTLEAKEQTTTPKLVFHQYAGAYFLSEFWGGHGQGKKVTESAQENELARKQAPKDLTIAAR